MLTQMKELKNNGIYTLPNGAAYVAQRVAGGRFFLYLCQANAFSYIPTHLVTPEGCIQPWYGGSREWAAEELTDTGKLYDPKTGANCLD